MADTPAALETAPCREILAWGVGHFEPSAVPRRAMPLAL
jgi:hypothetical protein